MREGWPQKFTDLRNITAGQRHVVPRAGLEPATKRLERSEFGKVLLFSETRVFPWIFRGFTPIEMSVPVAVSG